MSAHELSINVNDLDVSGRDYRFAIRPGWVRGLLEGHEASASEREGSLAVRASKSGSDVVVTGKLDAELSIPCARCLEPVALPIKTEIAVLYVPSSKLVPSGKDAGERELDAEEANTLPFDGEVVVLDDLVRDELLLEIPMIPLCSEACPGMSPPPAKAGNDEKPIDPRLMPLLNLGAKKP